MFSSLGRTTLSSALTRRLVVFIASSSVRKARLQARQVDEQLHRGHERLRIQALHVTGAAICPSYIRRYVVYMYILVFKGKHGSQYDNVMYIINNPG